MTHLKASLARWKREALHWTVLILLVVILRSSAFGIYVVPTGSMLPTIQLGDRIFANKLVYGLNIPFADRHLISWKSPRRGDIVLFPSPVDGITLVKRVVGLPGDTVEFSEGRLTINGTVVSEKASAATGLFEPPETTGSDDAHLLVEDLPEGPSHFIFRGAKHGQTFFERRKFQVPAGNVFCVGDNRDNSADSRSWGFVEIERIMGRGEFVLWSARSEGLLPTEFRWSRFFSHFDRPSEPDTRF